MNVEVGQVHMVSLQDEVTIVEKVLESVAAKVDPVAPFLRRPVQLCACEGFDEGPYHSDIATLGNGNYKKVCGSCTFVHTMWKGTKLHREFTSDVLIYK